MPLGMTPVGMMTIIVALVILGDADVDVVIRAKNTDRIHKQLRKDNSNTY
jgi:hypothetical protein